jgi:ACT domain-containing protein
MVYHYSDQQIKHIVEEAARKLGANASNDEIQNIVKTVIQRFADSSSEAALSPLAQSDPHLKAPSASTRVILTAFGHNKPGVIAAITKALADAGCDIQDMTQKRMQEFYSIMIIFDLQEARDSFETIRDNLLRVGAQIGAKCLIQHEDIFKGMHRI